MMARAPETVEPEISVRMDGSRTLANFFCSTFCSGLILIGHGGVADRGGLPVGM